MKVNHVTKLLSMHVSPMCALRKPYNRSFSAADMIIKTKLMFLKKYIVRVSEVLAVKAAAHLHLKRHAIKQHVSVSTQNRHIHNYIRKYLCGTFS